MPPAGGIFHGRASPRFGRAAQFVRPAQELAPRSRARCERYCRHCPNRRLRDMSLPTLSLLETRILGVLVEKQHTVPDSYPLSLNALVAGCNQKTARAPIMDVGDADVLAAIDGLKSLSLVFEGSGSRVVRFEHNAGRVLGVPGAAVALLAALMLRGPQTAAELR